MRSILALERAEYLGRRAGVRYSRSLVARRTGLMPAVSKMRRANWNQDIGAPPAMWKRPEMSFSTRSMVRAASSGAKVGELLHGEEKAKGQNGVAHLSQVFSLDSNPVA